MKKEERREIWERYLTDANIIEAKFFGSTDLLSDYPEGHVCIHARSKDFRSKEFDMDKRARIALYNFDKYEEVNKVDTLWFVGDSYQEYIDEYIEEEKEFYEEISDKIFMIDILKDGKFIWDYVYKRKENWIMPREERQGIWESYLTDDNVKEVVFMGPSDLLSDDPAGLVFVHCHKKGGRFKPFPQGEKEFDVLFNFDTSKETTRITELWLLDGEYEEYLHEYLEEYKESYGEDLEEFYVIDILKDGEFRWNYRK